MRFRVSMKFVINGSVDVTAPDDATDAEIARIAEERGGDVVEKMMRVSNGGSASVLPVRPLSIRRVVRRR